MIDIVKDTYVRLYGYPFSDSGMVGRATPINVSKNLMHFRLYLRLRFVPGFVRVEVSTWTGILVPKWFLEKCSIRF